MITRNGALAVAAAVAALASIGNLTMLPGAVSHPEGDAARFDVLRGTADDVIGRHVTVLTAVAVAGLPMQRAVWRRATAASSVVRQGTST